MTGSGKAVQLDRPKEPDVEVTEEQASDPKRLARLLMSILRDVAAIRRRHWPRRIDFEDVALGSGGAAHRFPHGFRSRVRWWVVDWQGASAPVLSKSTSSDDSTLVLESSVAGTATIRIEAEG